MKRKFNTSWFEAADTIDIAMSNKFGHDIPGSNAVIIGDVYPIKPSWALYDGAVCVCGRRDSDTYQTCKADAKAWFESHGGRAKWPNGLELRTWNAEQ